jgi:hypothetical protein
MLISLISGDVDLDEGGPCQVSPLLNYSLSLFAVNKYLVGR